MKRKIITAVGISLSAAVFAVSLFMLIFENVRLHNDKKTFDELANLVTSDNYLSGGNNVLSLTEPEIQDESDLPTDGEYKTENSGIKRDISLIKALNTDTFGWICIDGTSVNYPVMHTPNDAEYYLRRNFYKNYSISGTPFLDARCGKDTDNLIIYGHNMKNGTMFSDLTSYTDVTYAKEHPVVELEFYDALHIYEIYCVAAVKNSDPIYSFTSSSGEESFKVAVEAVVSKAFYTIGDAPAYGDGLLTLSTCYGSDSDGRLVVICIEKR